MKKILFLALMSVLLPGICLSAEADQEKITKVGFVDIDKVFSAFDEAEGISDLIKAEKKKTLDELERMEGEIKKERESLERGEELSEEEKKRMREEITDKLEEMVSFQRKREEQERKPLIDGLEKIYEAVKRIGKREDFDIIVERRDNIFRTTVLFAKESLNLTEKVISELKKKQG